ncbi:MAG: transcriptional regulator [Pseudomonadota bacterium]
MADPAPKPRVWRFAGFSLDESLGELTGNGAHERLRPKTLAVLRYLLDNPGRLLEKSELMSEVWGDAIVTEDSLTQCIAELRRACGDGDRTLIKTVPRRGFVFDALVERVDEAPESSLPKPNRTRRMLAVAACVFVAAVALSIALRQSDALRPKTTDVVAVVDITAGPVETRSGAILITEALRLRLDEIEALSIREVGTAASTSEQLDVSRSHGIDWLITGEIVGVAGGESARMQLWLWQIDNSSRFSLGVFSLPERVDTQSTAEFLALRDLIVERALTRLPGYVVDTMPGDFPADLRDFEVYAAVMAELELEQCNPDLVGDIAPVVDNTPTFMRGWMALAWASWVESWACGLGDNSLLSAVAAADQVLTLRPNYPQAIKVKSSAMAAMGDVREALGVAMGATEEAPGVAALWSTQSYLLNYVGALDASEAAMDRALALDPLVLVAETGETPNVYLYVTDWQRYLETQPPFDSPFFNFQRAYALFRLGDSLRAAEIAADTRQRFPSDLYSRFCAALLALIEGVPERAVNILVGIMEERDADGLLDGEVAYRESMMLLLAGATDLAVQRLWTAAEQDFVCPECVVRDPAWAALLAEQTLEPWFKQFGTDALFE